MTTIRVGRTALKVLSLPGSALEAVASVPGWTATSSLTIPPNSDLTAVGQISSWTSQFDVVALGAGQMMAAGRISQWVAEHGFGGDRGWSLITDAIMSSTAQIPGWTASISVLKSDQDLSAAASLPGWTAAFLLDDPDLASDVLLVGDIPGWAGAFTTAKGDVLTGVGVLPGWTAGFSFTGDHKLNAVADIPKWTSVFSLATSAVTGYPKAVLDDGADMYLRFKEASGTTSVDAAGHANGTHHGGPTLGVTSLLQTDPLDHAIQYVNGSYTTRPTVDSPDDFSVEFLLSAGAGGVGTVVMREDLWQIAMEPSGFGYSWVSFYLFSTGGSFLLQCRSSVIDSTEPIHIVFSLDGSSTTLKCYQDGVLVETSTGSGAWSNSSDPDVPILVGNNVAANDRLNGRTLDELAYYKGDILTPLEAATHNYLARYLSNDTTVAGAIPKWTSSILFSGLCNLTVAGTVPRWTAVTDIDSGIDLPDIVMQGTAQPFSLDMGNGALSVSVNLDLIILDPKQHQAPTSLQVTVSGAEPNAQLGFRIDDQIVWIAYADVDGNLGHTSIPVAEMDKGTHTLYVNSVANGEDSETFTLKKDSSPFPQQQAHDADPVHIDGSEGRWVLQDLLPGGLGSWVMPINPATMTNPEFEKNVTVGHTTAVNSGRTYVAEGGLQVKNWTLTGYCPDKAYYDQLMAYGEIQRRLYIIDHRGRAWKCAITSATVETRKRKVEDGGEWNDWTGNWTIQATILNQNWRTPA